MATPKKDGKVWRVQINKLGVRDSGTFPTKAAAAAWITKRESEIMAGKTGRAPAGTTFGDLLTKYALEVSPKKKGEAWETNFINRFKATHPEVCAVLVSGLTTATLAKWRDARLLQVSSASVTREWTVLTHALKIAVKEWHWLHTNPMAELDRPKDSAARTRRPSAEEITQLQAQLKYDPATAPTSKTELIGWAMAFAIETALRAGELCKLEWKDVHIEARHIALPIVREGKFKGRADTKTGAARDVPLSTRAIAVLAMMQSIRVRSDERVFQLAGATLDTLFRRARDACGIEDLHWHDFRAEALTRLAKKVPIQALARMSGHSDINELMTYYRESPTDIALMLD